MAKNKIKLTKRGEQALNFIKEEKKSLMDPETGEIRERSPYYFYTKAYMEESIEIARRANPQE